MQIKIFTIPIMGGERLEDELNQFLRSKKILQTDHQLVNGADGACWCFCIKYVEDINANDRDRPRTDYRKLLDETAFERFVALKEIRKGLAQSESVPAYAVFTDEELSMIAKLEQVTLDGLKTIKGIGVKKVERYGQYFVTDLPDETN